ncbi:MAG: hypothetical protein ACLP1X_01825 [Polyangiaceae bacterium]
MAIARSPLLHLALACAWVACSSVPDETQPPPGGRLIQPAGVIRGNVVYSGPHPCSDNGHIVGSAIVLVFDRANPPPPSGLASTALNFGVATGDVLFANEPRYAGAELYCPLQHGITDTITVSAPFTISPVDPASYVLEAFYDYTGDFLPTFKFRDLPEKGDVGGGDIDTADALKPVNFGNLDYQPHFLPVDVGIPQPLPAGAPPTAVPTFVMPDTGYIADNVTVTMGEVLTLPRPYFFPVGAESAFDATKPTTFQAGAPLPNGSLPTPDMGSPDLAPLNPTYAPVLTIPQDLQVLAPPVTVNQANVDHYEASFPHLVLQGGLPAAEQTIATASSQPFHFQLPPTGGALSLWQNASFDSASQVWVPLLIPEGQNIPSIWPLVVLTKLVDDPTHTVDPASLTEQGSATAPVIVLQAITLLGEGSSSLLFDTIGAAQNGALFDASGRPVVRPQSQMTVLLRPNVICFDSLFDPTQVDKRGTLVTPYLLGTTADLPTGMADALIAPPSVFDNPQVAALVKGAPVTACLPIGRYAINVVYPDGQAWTVPNEAGGCSGTEGSTNYATPPPQCTLKPRPVLVSQGPRAVVEIVPTADSTHCGGEQAVPPVCLPQASDAGAD